ncbi:MAG: class I SAM-dependent methyltransferase [Methanomicrobium sp.]|nr:class I SAM-dependent methyltransferase [Methanomicrobium sp.]
MTENKTDISDISNMPDYAGIWRKRMEEVFESDEKHGNRVKWDSVDHARSYWERTKKDRCRPSDQLESINLQKTERFLDIGSGPGTLGIPAAKLARDVVCVEPSLGMCTIMNERMAEENLSNVTVVRKKWEDVDLEKDLKIDENGLFDVVAASYSLSMTDIAEQIRRMEKVCRGRIFLFWFAGEYEWENKEFGEFMRSIGAADFYPGPKADLLYGALAQMGIYPNMRTYSLNMPDEYPSADVAAEKIGQRHAVSDPANREKLRDWINSHFDGKVTLHGRSGRVCMFWDVKKD